MKKTATQIADTVLLKLSKEERTPVQHAAIRGGQIVGGLGTLIGGVNSLPGAPDAGVRHMDAVINSPAAKAWKGPGLYPKIMGSVDRGMRRHILKGGVKGLLIGGALGAGIGAGGTALDAAVLGPNDGEQKQAATKRKDKAPLFKNYGSRAGDIAVPLGTAAGSLIGRGRMLPTMIGASIGTTVSAPEGQEDSRAGGAILNAGAGAAMGAITGGFLASALRLSPAAKNKLWRGLALLGSVSSAAEMNRRVGREFDQEREKGKKLGLRKLKG